MEKLPKNVFYQITSLVVVCLLSFSSLLTFSDRIASKPTDAGFWLIFACGLTVGTAIIGIPLLIKNARK